MFHFKRLKESMLIGLFASSSLIVVSSTVYASTASDIVKQVADAMGGESLLASIQNQSVTAELDVFVASQADEPGGDPVEFETIEFEMTRGLDGERYNTKWDIRATYPLLSRFSYTEIINKEHGAILGVHGFVPIPESPMLAIRLGARKIHNFVTSPLEMVKVMLDSPDEVKLLGSNEWRRKNFTLLSFLHTDSGKEIMVWIDNNNNLPKKTVYWDSDPSHGDFKVVTFYSEWQSVSGVMVPMKIKQFNKDGVVSKTQRTSVSFDNVYYQDPFEVPAHLTVPLDKKAYRMGQKYSNMFQYSVLSGAPFDLNLYTPETVFLDEVAEGIFHLRSYTHHSLIVEMEDYLVLFDPVLFEERTQEALPIIKQKWPDKRIKYVVPTHFHGDHSGGLRGYVADGAELLVIKPDAKFYRRVLNAKRNIYPDILSVWPKRKRMSVIDENEEYVFDDGKRKVRLLQIDNRHAPGLIVPYIEDEKLIFVSDLYNPGNFSAPIPPQFSYWGLDLYNDLMQRDLDIQTVVGAHGGVTTFEEFKNDIENTFFNTP